MEQEVVASSSILETILISGGSVGLWEFGSYLLKRFAERKQIHTQERGAVVENVESSVEILLKVQENLRVALDRSEGKIKEYEQKFMDLSRELGTMAERIRELESKMLIKDAEIIKLRTLINGVCPMLDKLEQLEAHAPKSNS